jgi:hypothetical protein
MVLLSHRAAICEEERKYGRTIKSQQYAARQYDAAQYPTRRMVCDACGTLAWQVIGKNQQPRGFAHVTFADETDVDRAVRRRKRITLHKLPSLDKNKA